MNAAGWHLCLDVLDDVLNGVDTPRTAVPDAESTGLGVVTRRYEESLGVS